MSIKSFPDYKDLLQENYVEYKQIPQLEEFQSWIIFQQDGTPPHWGSDVNRFLDATFSSRWIGRYGPIPWLPRSPDITGSCGYFIAGTYNIMFLFMVSGTLEIKLCS